MEAAARPFAEGRHHAAGHEDVFHRTRFAVRHGSRAPYARASAVSSRRTRSRSSGVSTPMESCAGFDHLDGKTVLEHAQLLERFTAFERRGLERRHLQQKFTPLDVQTDMFKWSRRVGPAGGLADSGTGAREKYSANPWRSITTFTTFGSRSVVGVGETAAKRGHRQRRVVAKRFDGLRRWPRARSAVRHPGR